MKTFKFLFFVLALCFATSTNAQFSRGGGFGENNHRFIFDVKFGGITPSWTNMWNGRGAGFGIGFGYQVDIKEFNDWTLAWDVANIEFAAPFDSPKNLDLLALKSGLRLFTPTFFGDKWRAYTNLSVGYSCVLQRGGNWDYYVDWNGNVIYYNDDSIKANHGFGLTFGVGLQLNQKYSFGYTLQYETGCKSKSHFGTFGFAF